jgi:hypothetical protein
VSRVDPARRKLRCCVCKQKGGAPLQCGGSKACFTAVHVTCARDAGWTLASKPSVQQLQQHQVQQARQQGQQGQPRQAGPDSSSGSNDGNGSSPEGQTPATAAAAAGNMAAPAAGAAGAAPQLPGAGITVPYGELTAQAMPKGKRPSSSGRPTYGTTLGDGSQLLCYCPKHAGTLPAGGIRVFASVHVQRNEWLAQQKQRKKKQRRGSKLQRGAGADGDDMMGNGPPGLQLQLLQDAGVAGAGAMQQGALLGTPREQGLLGIPGDSPLPLEPLRPPAGATLLQRYQHMSTTEGFRVRSGASGIHGQGVFATLPHKAGDLVVEYRGEVISRAEADEREARQYDQLVGAGGCCGDVQQVAACQAGHL